MDMLLDSLGVALLGMSTVFVGLIILIVFITLLTKLTASAKSPKKAPAADKPAPEAPKAPAAPVAAPAASSDEGTVSPEIVAAIAAALTVMMGEGKFTVRHIRRISNAPAWNRAGREEQVYSRF